MYIDLLGHFGLANHDLFLGLGIKQARLNHYVHKNLILCNFFIK